METVCEASSACNPNPVQADSELWTASWMPAELHATEHWWLRANDGATSRANSAVPKPLSGAEPAVAIAELEQFYRARGLRPRVQLPRNARCAGIGEALTAAGYVSEFATLVQQAPLSKSIGPDLDSLARSGLHTLTRSVPSGSWTELYLSSDGRGDPVADTRQLAILTRTPSLYCELKSDTRTVGIARLTIIARTAALTGMVVAPDLRGQRLGSGLLRHLLSLAAAHDCTSMALQVVQANESAIRLYASAGFETVDSYEYRVATERT